MGGSLKISKVTLNMVPLLSVNVMKESGNKYVCIPDQVKITAMKQLNTILHPIKLRTLFLSKPQFTKHKI